VCLCNGGGKKIKQGRPRDAVCFGTFNELIVAPAEAANQVSYAEGNGSSRLWALLYGCAKEILSPAGAFANGFHGIRRCLLHLPVGILYCIFRLFCLALDLGFYVAGSSSESLFHLAAEVFGVTDKAIARVFVAWLRRLPLDGAFGAAINPMFPSALPRPGSAIFSSARKIERHQLALVRNGRNIGLRG
jgi:hypothetical protein